MEKSFCFATLSSRIGIRLIYKDYELPQYCKSIYNSCAEQEDVTNIPKTVSSLDIGYGNLDRERHA